MAGPTDTWSDYSREHAWEYLGAVDTGPLGRQRIWCERCGQTREVWNGATPAGYRWGCPRVPWWYRLGLLVRGRPLPTWSVNGAPPWI